MERHSMLMDWNKIIVKMSMPRKAIYTFNAIPIKIPTVFFHRTRTNNPKICVENKRPQITNEILKKKNKLEVSQIQTSSYTTKL